MNRRILDFVTDEFTFDLGHGLTVQIDYKHAGPDYLGKARVRVYVGGQEIACPTDYPTSPILVPWIIETNTEPSGLATFLDAFGVSGQQVVDALMEAFAAIAEASVRLPGADYYQRHPFLEPQDTTDRAKADAAYDQWRWELLRKLGGA